MLNLVSNKIYTCLLYTERNDYELYMLARQSLKSQVQSFTRTNPRYFTQIILKKCQPNSDCILYEYEELDKLKRVSINAIF